MEEEEEKRGVRFSGRELATERGGEGARRSMIEKGKGRNGNFLRVLRDSECVRVVEKDEDGDGGELREI